MRADLREAHALMTLARHRCASCVGTGRSARAICNCVHRTVFRGCLRQYHGAGWYLDGVSYGYGCGIGIRSAEYRADFWLIARRHLDPLRWRVFEAHFLRRMQWRECCRELRMDRGTFFHAVYRIEQRLGRVFRELRPYALFPADVYFGNPDRLVDLYLSGSYNWMYAAA